MNMPSTIPYENIATNKPQPNAPSQSHLRAPITSRNSNATPRNISPSSMKRIGKYTTGTMITNANKNTAKSPPPPRINHVSLKSQTGTTELIIRLHDSESRRSRNIIPTPRSKPSSSTYINTTSAKM